MDKLSKLRALAQSWRDEITERSMGLGPMLLSRHADAVDAILDSPEPEPEAEPVAAWMIVAENGTRKLQFGNPSDADLAAWRCEKEPLYAEPPDLESLNKLWGKLHNEMAQERNSAKAKLESLRAQVSDGKTQWDQVAALLGADGDDVDGVIAKAESLRAENARLVARLAELEADAERTAATIRDCADLAKRLGEADHKALKTLGVGINRVLDQLRSPK